MFGAGRGRYTSDCGDNPSAADDAAAAGATGGQGNDRSHSGFGDGSNPGQGADHNHSGNDGTNNPSGQ